MFDTNCIFWCECCESVSYRFICCGNSACNAGGCDMCIPIWQNINVKLQEIEPRINVDLLRRTGKLEIRE